MVPVCCAGLIEILLPSGVSLRVDTEGRRPGTASGSERVDRAMIALPSEVRVFLACGVTDMRQEMVGLEMLVQQGLAADPFDGAVFAFRGRRAGLIKLICTTGSACAC